MKKEIKARKPFSSNPKDNYLETVLAKIGENKYAIWTYNKQTDGFFSGKYFDNPTYDNFQIALELFNRIGVSKKLHTVSSNSISDGSWKNAVSALDICTSESLETKQMIHQIITVLIKRYGTGYDNIKTLSIILERIKSDFEMLDSEM